MLWLRQDWLSLHRGRSEGSESSCVRGRASRLVSIWQKQGEKCRERDCPEYFSPAHSCQLFSYHSENSNFILNVIRTILLSGLCWFAELGGQRQPAKWHCGRDRAFCSLHQKGQERFPGNWPQKQKESASKIAQLWHLGNAKPAAIVKEARQLQKDLIPIPQKVILLNNV